MGKVVLPLLKIARAPETRGYRLKGRTLRKSADGDAPRVLLSTHLEFDLVKAARATVGAAKTKYEQSTMDQQFTMEKFRTNANRLKELKGSVSEFSKKISSVLSWEDPFKTTYALITYILMVLYMELWALPILPLLLLLFHWFHRQARTKSNAGEEEERVPGEEEDEHDGDDDRDDDDQEEWNLADRVKMVVKSAQWMQ